MQAGGDKIPNLAEKKIDGSPEENLKIENC